MLTRKSVQQHRKHVFVRAVPRIDSRGSKLSEGGSSSSHWSSGHGGESPATPPDKCLDVESGWAQLDEPAVLKRRVSEAEGQVDVEC